MYIIKLKDTYVRVFCEERQSKTTSVCEIEDEWIMSAYEKVSESDWAWDRTTTHTGYTILPVTVVILSMHKYILI